MCMNQITMTKALMNLFCQMNLCTSIYKTALVVVIFTAIAAYLC